MDSVRSFFDKYPSQYKVANVMLKHGIRVKDGDAYCGDIHIADSALGKAANVDRRVVRSTLEKICEDQKLYSIFSKLNSIMMLSDVASEIGCTTLEIVPTDATMPGILMDVTSVICNAGVSVRQAVVVDSVTDEKPHLIVVTNGTLPSDFIPYLKSCRGVDSIILR